MAARKKAARKQKPASTGLTPDEVATPNVPPEAAAVAAAVTDAGGRVLGGYRDPLGAHWLTLAVLPLDRVAPTPFQRDLSDAHVKRLQAAIEKVGTYVDPIVAVPVPDHAREEAGAARFWTPNGLHRWSALGRMGARSVVALVSTDAALAYRILALNTEKAHTTKERALEAVRMARGLAEIEPDRPESDYLLELEDGSLVTLGLAYEKRARFAGGAYAAALKASDGFLEVGIEAALSERGQRAERLLALDERVAEIMKELAERGFDSPYLRNFVVARIRPFRPRGKPAPDAEGLLDHMEQAAARFDTGKIRADQVAKTAGSE